METIEKFLRMFYIQTFNISDLFEIIIIIYVIYKLISSLKDTRAWIILKGILMLCAFYLIAYICSFDIIKIVFQSSITICIIALVVIFQQELKKMLEQIGNKNFSQYILDFKNKAKKEEHPKRMSDKSINEIVSALFELGKAKTGSLIVIEKDVPLNDIVATGISLDADISSALLINIFEKNTPLHDGAIIIKNDKIVSATCYLPLSNNPEISKSLGTRHRAGIGVTESVDCMVLISSEETGQVSYVENGKITRNVTPEKLKKALQNIQEYPQNNIIKSSKRNIFNTNFKTKAFAVILGCAFWLISMSAIDPVTRTTFDDIPINVINADSISDLNKTYDLGDISTVDVTLEDKNSILNSLNENDIKATIDLSKLSSVNSVEVEVTVDNNTTDIVKIKDSIIKVSLEDISYAEFPVEIETKGKPESGFSIKEIELNRLTATVIGAESQINKIEKVVAELNIQNVKDGDTISFIPVVYDKNGDVVDKDKLNFNNESFSATIYLERTKTIPLNITAYDDNGSAGQIKDISYETQEITISGLSEDLEKIDALDIKIPVKIDISDDNNTKLTKVITLSDYLPEGISLVNGEQKVTITITYEPYPTTTVNVNSSQLKLNNTNEDFNYTLQQQTIPIQVMAPQDIISTFKSEDLSITVNVADITAPGTYDVPVEITSNKNITTKQITVKVLVSEK